MVKTNLSQKLTRHMNSHNLANIEQLEANEDENKVVEEQTMLMEIIKDKELIVSQNFCFIQLFLFR